MVINPSLWTILAVLLVVGAAQESSGLQFTKREGALSIEANWLENTAELEPYIQQYGDAVGGGLRSLSLSFTYCKDPKYILSSFFGRDIKVEELYVNLDTCKVGDEGVELILARVGREVKSLHLILGSAGTTTRLGGILGSRIAEFKLKSLKIGLMMAGLGDQGLSQFLLRPLSPGLEHLSLDLGNNKLTRSAFSNFTFYLSRVES
jgi:hypothetical protein